MKKRKKIELKFELLDEKGNKILGLTIYDTHMNFDQDKDNVIEYVAKFMGHSYKMFTSYRKLNVEERIKKFIEEDRIDGDDEEE